ncbi:CBO0543 family protein [Paenibacillus sp. GCM10027628]|uniref:CBO0543 family protein n=1 Tax=Paenibacillus sp. GCM10027628 TaxID=3273413 RepID=UPI003626ECD7
MLMYLIVFFAKCVLSSSLDSYFIKKGRISYPVRPMAKTFDTNILYDLLFYPLLSIIWVRSTYNSKPLEMLTRSLYYSVPMSALQWFLERKTALFKWKAWSVWHSFASINFTLFTIRGLVGLIRRLNPISAEGEHERNDIEPEKNINRPSSGLIANIAGTRSPYHHYEQIR